MYFLAHHKTPPSFTRHPWLVSAFPPPHNPRERATPSSPVEVWDQPVLVSSAQVVEDLLVLAEQADVVGGRERHFGKARDGFHHLVLVGVDSEVSPVLHVTCYYF